MTAQLLWTFRFPILCLVFIITVLLGWNAYNWKDNQLKAERVLVAATRAELKTAYKTVAAMEKREKRIQEIEIENARLRKDIAGILSSPQGRTWATTPLPAGLLERLSLAVGQMQSSTDYPTPPRRADQNP